MTSNWTLIIFFLLLLSLGVHVAQEHISKRNLKLSDDVRRMNVASRVSCSLCWFLIVLGMQSVRGIPYMFLCVVLPLRTLVM